MASAPPKHGASILHSLNSAQRRAVTSDLSTVAILAGPGSGKTHTLTSRVVWLVDHVGYRPQDVVVATFTVKAAKEMKERIGRALGGGREKLIVLGTFHSIARRYLAAYGRLIGLQTKFGIADDGDSRSIINRICKRLQLAIDPPVARSWISKKKAGGTEVESAAVKKQSAKLTAGSQEYQICYEEYQKHLESSNLMDYDDLLVRCAELLRNHPNCVSNIQTVLIDEYQDTNGIQYELMKLFAQRHNRITIVGDPDQSIYGWRSAEIRNLWRLLRDFRETDEIALEENYRSSQSILDLSLRVIQQDKKRYQKKLTPVHSKGSRPVLRRLESASAEADWIVSEIRRTVLMTGSMLNHGDMAILLRSAALSRHIESALGKAGIPYRMVGGFKFYDRAEIKTLLDYLRVIHQPENNDALARIMNVPKRGIGEGTIKSLVDEAERSSLSLWALLVKHFRGDRIAKTKVTKHAEQKLSGGLFRHIDTLRKKLAEKNASDDAANTTCGLAELIEQLLKATEFRKFLQDSNPKDHEQKWANVQEFVNLATDFERDLTKAEEDDALPEIEGLEQAADTEVLPRFLANVALASDAQKGQDGEEAKPLITISTIHAAKGLEWPVVFVPAVYNGVIPHSRSEDGDEERRLLYVAMTRAQSLLYLSCPLYGSGANSDRTELSAFISPISGSFAKKGPCLDRQVVSQIAQILRRQLPSEDAIFKGLPPMYNIEDNLLPVDPEAQQQESAGRDGFPSNAPRSKRPRLQAPAKGQDSGEEPRWHKGYATTMEQSSGFTVAALPGFVSAGSKQVALAVEAATAEANAKIEQSRKKPANRRSADQKSIIALVRSASGGGTTAAPVSASGSRPPASSTNRPVVQAVKSAGNLPIHGSLGVPHAINPPKEAIDPELAGHKLGSVKLSRPVQTTTTPVAGRKHYNFSSSPVKADIANPAPVNEDEKEPPPSPTRAASCLHTTTYNLPKGLGGGFRRPPGLSRETIGPMAKLRKPFKPLTINRPS